LRKVRGMKTIVATLGIALGIAGSLAAQPAAETLALDELVPGQRGYGETVFSGSEIERFEVEVLGVLKELSPGISYALVRLEGHDLERSGVVAGMSGSPVWIDGKLVGAVAFSWPYAQDAIAGVTPIGSMRGVPATAPWTRNAGSPRVSWDALARRAWPEDLLRDAAAPLARFGPDGARSSVVWSASGFSPAGLSWLSGLLPSASVAGAGRTDDAPAEIRAGSSIAAVFVDGDFRLAATGTVTERIGDELVAFGHPVAGGGEIRLPMAPAEVVTVLASRSSSFKLANAGPIVGAFERDHASGTSGRIGAVAEMVPLTVDVKIPSPRRYEMRLARVPEFLPSLASIASFAALDAASAIGGIRSIDLRFVLDLGKDGRLELEQSFDGDGSPVRALSFLVAVVDFLVRTDLGEIDLRSIDVEWTPHDRPRALTVVDAHASTRRVAPGDEVEIRVDLKPYRGETERRVLTVTVPAEQPAGGYPILVGDGASLDGVRLSVEPREPRTLAQALDFLRSLGSSRSLGAVGLVFRPGVAAGGEALTNLPPSVRAIWSGAGPATKALRTAVASDDEWPSDSPVAGVVRLDLEVERDRAVRGTRAKTNAPARRSATGGSRRGGSKG